MQRPQQLAAAFLVGAFLVGGTVGYAADRMMLAGRSTAKVDHDGASTDAFAEELELSTTQRAAVDSILAGRNRVMDSLVAPVRPQLRAARDDARRQIATLLNTVQQEKFAGYVARMARDSSAQR